MSLSVRRPPVPWLAVGLAAALGAGTTRAAEPELLTLEEAMELAVANNHDLRRVAAAAAAAEAGLDAARAERWPVLELSEAVTHTTDPVAVFGNLLRQDSFTADDFALDSLNDPDPLTNFGTALELRQPVWTAGRIASGIDAARHGAVAAGYELDRARRVIVRAVVDAHSGAILARSQRDVVAESLRTARAHVELVRDLFAAGLVVRSDLLQAELRVSELEEQRSRAESAVALSDARLNLVLGLDVQTPHRLPTDLDPVARPEASLSALIEEARGARADLRAADAALEGARSRLRRARAERWPELGVGAVAAANAESFIGADGTHWTLAASFRFRLFDGGRTAAAVRAAEEQVQIRAAARAELRDRIGLEVSQAYYDLLSALRRVEEAERSERLGREALRIVEDRYEEGLATWVEVLDAETALSRALSRGVAARRDTRVAEAALELALGRT